MSGKQKIILSLMCIIGSVVIFVAYKYKTGNKNDFSGADIEVISDIFDSSNNNEKNDNSAADDENDNSEIPQVTDNTSIKVLLSDNGSYYQSNVKISCDTNFYVNYGEKALLYEKDTVINLNEISEEKSFTEITIRASEDDGKITVLSMEKSDGNPSYRGEIKITLTDSGYIIVNELPLEEYLYSVVSSEMPSSYESEALKAQAVCARTYAVKKMQENAYEEYDADIDDTTSCQVYNNISETEASVNAVNDTSGIIMTCEGKIIDAYFFSTSCGTTCRNDDVWTGSKESYLNDKLEAYTGDSLSDESVMVMSDGGSLKISDGALSSEDIFRKFIDNEIYINAIEKDASLYRWRVSFDNDLINNVIYGGLAALTSDAGGNVTFTDKSGTEMKTFSSIDSTDMEALVGEIQNIEVNERGYSGIAQSVVIYGSNANVVVKEQLTIRKLFNPESADVVNQDGEKLLGQTSLPSAYFYINKENDGSYVIYGGGYGHGVGMSQNGANALAKKGYGYKDILMHYFDGVDLENLI